METIPNREENVKLRCDVCFGTHKTSDHEKFPLGGADTDILENVKKRPHLGDFDNQVNLNK
jgi:hypothetical protein